MVTIFEQGDIVYLDFDPQAGHEQKDRRPALVISNNLFNRVSSLTRPRSGRPVAGRRPEDPISAA